MRGTMMDFPLTLPTILERAGRIFPRVEIVSRKPDKSITRTCYGELHSRARRLASSLTKLGMKRGDRVASMMWNHSKHLEAFCGVPCGGGILHTLNLRLHPHEIAVIAKHAGDRFLLIDDVLLPVYERFHQSAPFEHVMVVPYGCNGVPQGFLNYEDIRTTTVVRATPCRHSREADAVVNDVVDFPVREVLCIDAGMASLRAVFAM